MINVSGVRRSFGSRVLLRDADLRVGARDRVALVGPNGSGKTTLLEMIAGIQAPDDGRIDLVGGATIGYLAQETDALRGRRLLDEVISARVDVAITQHRIELLERELEDNPDERLLDEFARLHDRFDTLGGWSVETEAKRILSGLGFSPDHVDRATETFSGGWLMRIALAKLLLAAPDALLLDEPTNHLDLESVVWLERFLHGYEGAVVVVSHDRDFMNSIATKVVEIDDATLVGYTGDYAAFVEQRALRAEQAAAAARNQARQVEHVQAFIERFRYKASKARQVQSRIKMLDRIDRGDGPKRTRRTMSARFPAPPRAGRVVLELRSVDFSYADTRVYDGLDLTIERGQKVALVGPNGAGKTTLLKLCAGVLEPDAGDRRIGHNVALGYFAQHQIEALDPSNRVIEEMSGAIPSSSSVRPRDLLGRFLFSGDDVDKPVSVLSGGERTRLALAKMLASSANFLCLDEPTNHLDVTSRDALEDALAEYEGTLLLITHDRHLIRSVANRVLEVVAGTATSFDGDYEYYLYRREQERQEAALPRVTPGAVPGAKDRRRAGAEQRGRTKALRDALRRAEDELERVNSRLRELESAFSRPDGYGSAELREYERLRDDLARVERDWERAATAVDAADTLGP